MRLPCLSARRRFGKASSSDLPSWIGREGGRLARTLCPGTARGAGLAPGLRGRLAQRWY